MFKLLNTLIIDWFWTLFAVMICAIVILWAIAVGSYGLAPIDPVAALRQSYRQHESLGPEFMDDKNKD